MSNLVVSHLVVVEDLTALPEQEGEGWIVALAQVVCLEESQRVAFRQELHLAVFL